MNHFPLLSFVIFLLCSSTCFGKAGPEIPAPAVPLVEAVRKVQTYYVKEFEKTPRDPGSDRFKRETIITQVSYTTSYADGRFDERPGDRDLKLNEWCWVITFVHPVQNSHSWVFQLHRDGSIKLLSSSI